MRTIRTSSIERRQWRDKCRKLLADHIRDRIGISIEPSDVRLVTKKDDNYCWQAVPHMRHLFLKQLSDHSLGAIKSLYHGLGVTFEAVPRSDRRSVTPQVGHEPTRLSTGSVQTTLSSRIDELQELNAELVKEISGLRDSLASELGEKERLLGELNLVNETNGLLRKEIQKKNQQCYYFRDASYKYSEGIQKLSLIVEGLRDTATFTEEGCF